MESNMIMSNAPWFLTVIRTQGMRLMRPDKEWRPIVTIDVRDSHHNPHIPHEHEAEHAGHTDQPQVFETFMGVDGQNPNLKHGLFIPGPAPLSTPPMSTSSSTTPLASSSTTTLTAGSRPSAPNARLAIGVWYAPPTNGKRKGKPKMKKRVLVGSAELGVGELLKLWEKERGKGRGALDLRLACHSPTKGAVSSRNGVYLTVRLRAPTTPPTPARDILNIETWEGNVTKSEVGVGRREVEQSPLLEEFPESTPTSGSTSTLISPVSSSPSKPSSSPKLNTSPRLEETSQLRRRKTKSKRKARQKGDGELKGYTIDSDPCPSPSCSSSSSGSSSCEPYSDEDSEEEREREREREAQEARARFLERWCRDTDVDQEEFTGGWPGKPASGCVCVGSCVCIHADGVSVGWVAASLLPQHMLHAGPSGSGVLENEAAAAWRAQMRSASMGVSLTGKEGEGGEDEKAALPAYTERVEVEDPDAPNLAERILATFTLYGALRAARLDSEFEAVFTRLQMEWGYVGGLLVALAAVNTAVLSISPDAIFTVHEYARGAVAASSVASGLGIACDAWFLLRYGWAEVRVVRARALDVFGMYFFFALSARTPSLCMFVAALSLMAFLGLVAFDAWPGGALMVCGLVGAVMSLQFLVWGIVWVGRGVRGGVRGVGKGVRGVVGASRGMVGRGRGRGGVGVAVGEKEGC